MDDEELNLDTYGYELPDWGDVGPNNNGTYTVPDTAQTSNTPWDSGGGSLGQYGSDVWQVLSQGVGVYSQYKKNQQFIDYQRYEATQGGIFQQGRPAGTLQAGVGVRATTTGNPLMLILLVGGAILLLRK